MSRCRQCKIEILDETERCPLCNSVLEPTIEVENMYPNVRTMTRKLMLISRIYLFCMILSEALLVYLNIILESQIWWCAITGFGMLYGYLLIRFAILGKSGYMSKMIVLIINAILLVVAIDFVLGYQGWSINYALPAGIILMDAGIGVLMIINRRNWQSYMMMQLFMVVCSILSLVLYLMEILTAQLLVLIALAASVFLFLGTLIIGDRRARVELKRRFHI
ncbi:MAG: zinc ribbon domain-containing protein [Roseburia sp.]|nr:zinc ribbon domain-containing protein [Roseburia sp.]